MANTINLQAALSLVGTGVNIAGSVNVSTAQVGSTGIGSTQSIATSATALVFTGATVSGGYLLIVNLDPTNYVEIDSSNAFTNFPQKVLPGKAILLMPETGTIYGKANTGAVEILIVGVTL